jgi:hypothetical protein
LSPGFIDGKSEAYREPVGRWRIQRVRHGATLEDVDPGRLAAVKEKARTNPEHAVATYPVAEIDQS